MKIEINLKGEISDKSFNDVNKNIDELIKNWVWYKKSISYEENKTK